LCKKLWESSAEANILRARIQKNVRESIRRLFGANRLNLPVGELYQDRDYLEAYSRHTDLRVAADPQSAVGGMWDEIGRLQFDFLVARNLRPHHKLLDLGCGTLRGGRHFIRYLGPGNYCGIDISREAVSAARQLIEQEGLSDKRPDIRVNEDRNLKFRDLAGGTFDYILAQSVFTHLKPEHIEECFENIGSIMDKNSVFYFTYKKGRGYKQTGLKNFRYPFSFFEALAQQNGFEVRDCSKLYPHPREQRMVELRWSSP
jgi:SAM-dependent methyltransferase